MFALPEDFEAHWLLPIFAAMVVGLGLMTYVPEISLWLLRAAGLVGNGP